MKFIKYVALSMVIAGCVSGEVWDATKEGSTGATGVITDSSAPSTIDDHIRMVYQQTRRRGGVGHHWGHGDGTADDNGLHRLGSARCYFQDAPPTSLNDSHSTPATIADYLNSSETAYGGVVDLNDAASNSDAGIEDDVGTARCWVDTNDNYRVYYYVGIAGDNTPSTIADGWVPASQLSNNNLIINGSFEPTDGTGVLSVTTIPIGWTLKGTVTSYSYEATDVIDGGGVNLQLVAGGNTSGVQQTLAGLTASTWYRASARVKRTTASSCQLNVTGGTRTYPSSGIDATTSSTMVTLSVWVLTDGTPASIVVAVEGAATTADCNFDHVSFVKLQGSASPGVQVYVDSASNITECGSAYTSGCSDIVSVTVRPPAPGYHAIIIGNVPFGNDASDTCWLEIHDGSNQLAEVYQINKGGEEPLAHFNLSIFWMSTALLVSDTPITYTLRARESGSENCSLTGDQTISMMLIPSGT